MLPQKFAHCAPRYPVRHRPKIPFRPIVRAPPDLPQRAMELRQLDVEMDRFILNARDYLELVVDAFAVNVHYSTKLEGNPLSLEEVRRLTRNSFEGIRAGKLDAPRQEIVNHLVSWISPTAYRTPWTTQLVDTHRFLMEGVEPESHPGQYRTRPAYLTQGRDVVFEGAKPDAVPAEVESLLRWLNEEGIAFFPVVTATVFFHEFESIHPFRDGNGRTGRTLFHAYLQTHGLPNAGLCKIEYELLRDPDLYYTLLSWTDDRESYAELIDFVMDGTLAAYREAIEAFRRKDLLSSGLEEGARRILLRAKQKGDWFKIIEAVDWVEGVGEQTVRRHLNDLLDKGALEAEGHTRARRYRFADPLRGVRDALSRAHRPDAAA